jgi:hypothetical protein
VRTPWCFSAWVMFCWPRRRAAGICCTIGSTFAAKAQLASCAFASAPAGGVAEQGALHLIPRQCELRPLGNQAALLLGQPGIGGSNLSAAAPEPWC